MSEFEGSLGSNTGVVSAVYREYGRFENRFGKKLQGPHWHVTGTIQDNRSGQQQTLYERDVVYFRTASEIRASLTVGIELAKRRFPHFLRRYKRAK